MKGTLTIIDLLNIFALFLSVFYAFQNWTLKTKSKANLIFTLYLIDIAFIILFFLLLKFNSVFSFVKYLIPFLVTALLLMPPLILKYQKIITGIKGNDKKHFLIPIVFGTLTLILMSLLIIFKKTPYQNLIFDILQYTVLFEITVLFIISNSYYIFLSLKLLNRHKKLIHSYYSYSEKIDLTWINYLIGGYIFMVLGFIISNLQMLSSEISDIVFYSVLIIYIMFTGHNALRQKEIKLVDSFQNVKQEAIENQENEEQFSEAQLQLFADLKMKLSAFITEQKPYLDQELTIFKLAKDLNTNTKYLSYVINKEFGQNFINFINDYRIEEVKRKLQDENSKNLTIEALAQNAGFKSKSSFNAAFKKSTGHTPSSFIKSKTS